MRKKRILITGGTGFIGGRFIKILSDKYEITNLDLRRELKDEDFKNFDTLVHLAALAHQFSGAPSENYYEINYKLTMKLAKKAKENGIKHFIFMSTSHVYGILGNAYDSSLRYNESSVCMAFDPYGNSKLMAEKFLQKVASESFGVAIVRAPMVYGPGSKGSLNSLKNLVRRFPLLPFKYSANRRSVIFIDNLVHFLSLIIDSEKSGIFLAQDREPVSIENIVRFLALALDRKVFLFCLPTSFFNFLKLFFPQISAKLFGTLAFDSSKTNSELGYSPIYSTEEAFQKTFSNN